MDGFSFGNKTTSLDLAILHFWHLQGITRYECKDYGCFAIAC